MLHKGKSIVSRRSCGDKSASNRSRSDQTIQTKTMGSKLSPADNGRSSELANENEYCCFDISALPEELFVHVLMFLPPADIVKRCSLVCKHWLAVCRDQALWKRKCEKTGRYVPGLMGPRPKDFMIFYFKCPYTRNLLRNTHAQTKGCWYKPGNHNTVTIEDTPAGAHPIETSIPPEEILGEPVKNWVTSYQFSSLTQQVYLLEQGCSEEVLDLLRPLIYVSVWCAARWDCGSKFQLVVKLLDKDNKTLNFVEKEKIMIDGDTRQIWHKVEHTFTDYKVGVRSIQFQMGGVDTQYWAGNFGAKFTLPCLKFDFSKKMA